MTNSRADGLRRQLTNTLTLRRRGLAKEGVEEYDSHMQFATGTVVNGKVEIQGVSLPEGAVVAVVARGADEAFTLTGEDEDELLASISEIERGEYLTVEQLLASLPKPN